MKIERPRFELARVYEDGTSEAPEIVPVTEVPWNTPMSRRGMLGVGVGAAAVLFLLEGEVRARSKDGSVGEEMTRPFQKDSVVKAPEKPALAHTKEIGALGITPDGKMLISGSEDNTVKFWSLPDGRWLNTLPVHTDNVSCLAITPDGKTLVTASANRLYLWTLPEGQPRTVIEAHADLINAIAITLDGKLLISGGNDKTVRLWSLPEGRPLATLDVGRGPIQTLALARNGKVLAAGGKENTLRFWSLPEGRLLMAFSGSTSERFAISADNETVAIGSYGIELHSLADGRLIKALEPRASVRGLTISADGKTLASSSEDNIFLWSLPEGKLLQKLEKAGYYVANLTLQRIADFSFPMPARIQGGCGH